MTSERIQRRIERLLDQAETAADEKQWDDTISLAKEVLTLDAANQDALTLLSSAERMGEGSEAPTGSSPASTPYTLDAPPQPTSFASGRYEVKRFLGEGGKKRVYLAHDTQLDRDVAFALIKTEGLDEQARQRITREAQAMGRLGSHPHIVTVYDIGEENGQPYLSYPSYPVVTWRASSKKPKTTSSLSSRR